MADQGGDRLRQALVKVLAADGGTIVGTGFLVHPDGFIATCSHVVQSEETQSQVPPPGEG